MSCYFSNKTFRHLLTEKCVLFLYTLLKDNGTRSCYFRKRKVYLTVVTHPRTNSLTFAVADRFVQNLIKAGHDIEVLDLHRSGIDPVLGEADEPDWTRKHKQYSTEVEAEIERMKKHDAPRVYFSALVVLHALLCLRGILSAFGTTDLLMAIAVFIINMYCALVWQPLLPSIWWPVLR